MYSRGMNYSFEVLIFYTECHLSTAVLFDRGSFPVDRQRRWYSYETYTAIAYSSGDITISNKIAIIIE